MNSFANHGEFPAHHTATVKVPVTPHQNTAKKQRIQTA